MAYLTNYTSNGQKVVKVLAGAFKAATTNDVLNAGTSYLAAGGTVAGLYNALFSSSTVQGAGFSTYGSAATDTAFVTTLVDALTAGTSISSTTKSTWVSALASSVAGYSSRGAFAESLMSALESYTGTDADLVIARDVVANRAEVGAYYAQSTAGATFTSVSALQTPVSSVTNATSTVTAATTSGNTSSVVTGSTYTLTTSADTVTGSSGNDTINAYVDAAGTTDTLTGADVVDGGSGTDTMNINVDGAAGGALPGASISNVEVFKIREVGGTAGAYDFAGVTGETSVINNKSTDDVTFTNLGASTTITIVGDGTTTNGATSFTMANATAAASITIDGGVTAGNITRNATGNAAITIASTGSANTVGTIDLDTAAAFKSLTISATTNLVASLAAADYAASSTITVSGAATTVDLSGAALSANVLKVDASGMTAGGVKVGVDQTNTGVDTQFIGGVGDDTLDIGKVVYDSTTLTAAGGSGTDTLKMTDAAALTSTTAKYITGFETLYISDDADDGADAFDVSLMSSLTGVTIGAISTSDSVTVSNLTAGQAAAVTLAGSQAAGPTFSVSGATTVGQLDTMTIVNSDGSSTVNTLTHANITAAGVETVNFTLTDNMVLSAATGLGALTKAVFTGAGTLSLTTGALAVNVNSTLDASALTGAVTLDLSSATANGFAIKGSATKANTVTGTNQNDAFTGGTGVDTFKNLGDAATDADTADFVSDSSADVFEIADITAAGTVTISNFDAATVSSAEDLINVSHDSVDGGEVVVTSSAAQAALTDDRTYVIEQTLGAAAALTTGGTATLTTADFTATTLTNVAAYLAERYTTSNDTNTDVVFVLNNGTNTYVYQHTSSANGTTIDAAELQLIGVISSAIVLDEDVTQTV